MNHSLLVKRIDGSEATTALQNKHTLDDKIESIHRDILELTSTKWSIPKVSLETVSLDFINYILTEQQINEEISNLYTIVYIKSMI